MRRFQHANARYTPARRTDGDAAANACRRYAYFEAILFCHDCLIAACHITRLIRLLYLIRHAAACLRRRYVVMLYYAHAYLILRFTLLMLIIFRYATSMLSLTLRATPFSPFAAIIYMPFSLPCAMLLRC